MKTKLILAIALLSGAAFGQTALTQTTTSAAITGNQTTIQVASLTGIACSKTALQPLYIIDPGVIRGELVQCSATSTSGGNFLTVQRGAAFRAGHVSGATVVISNAASYAQSFREYDPYGSCTAVNTLYTPWINTNNGRQWLCSTVTLSWVPGFNNPDPPGVTTLVASAAGLITPSGPLFHVNGTAAVTGFNIPVGYVGGGFCIIPDAVFTWTAANNIALAGTAVVNKQLCFTYDWKAAKFYPSYIA